MVVKRSTVAIKGMIEDPREYCWSYKMKDNIKSLITGPAGYHVAIRCAQLGLSTACIDKIS